MRDERKYQQKHACLDQAKNSEPKHFPDLSLGIRSELEKVFTFQTEELKRGKLINRRTNQTTKKPTKIYRRKQNKENIDITKPHDPNKRNNTQ